MKKSASVGMLYLYTFLVFSAIYYLAFKSTSKKAEISSNKIVFVWEGLEKDIPQDGEYIQITGTDENTVYLNSIDE